MNQCVDKLYAIVCGLFAATAFVVLIDVSLATAENITVTIKADSVIRTIPANFHGINNSTYWDNMDRSPGSANAFKHAGVELLRFPGGVPGLCYDWDNWQNARGCGNDNNAKTTSGPDSIRDYANAIGAKLLLQANTLQSATHNAGFIRYCKQIGITTDLWEIGNEPDGENIATYAATFNSIADSLKAVDPNAVIMGPANYLEFCTIGTPAFLKSFIQLCDSRINAVSMHYYPDGNPGSPGWIDTFMLKEAQQWMQVADSIKKVTTKPVYVTEWSTNKQPGSYHVGVNQITALAMADIIGAFARTNVVGHNMFGTPHGIYNNWGLLADNWNDSSCLGMKPEEGGPQYYIIPLWHAMGRQVLKATHNASNAGTVFNAWAHRSDSAVQVMLINKSSSTHSVTINFNGFDPTGKGIETYQDFVGQTQKTCQWPVRDLISYNGVVQPFASSSNTALPPPAVAVCQGNNYSLTIPALSITVLNFGKRSSSVKRMVGDRCSFVKKAREWYAYYDFRGKKLAQIKKAPGATHGDIAQGMYLRIASNSSHPEATMAGIYLRK
jgi:hypothetical protein